MSTQHLSLFTERYQSVAIAGKGKSLTQVMGSPEVQVIACNEAIYYVHGLEQFPRPIFTRCDFEKWNPFCRELPGGVIPILPWHAHEAYPQLSTFWYRWQDIGLADLNCTAVLSICLAATLGAEEIVLYGFDMLEHGDPSYLPEVMNTQNRKWLLTSQAEQFAALPADVVSRCRFASGLPLVDRIVMR